MILEAMRWLRERESAMSQRIENLYLGKVTVKIVPSPAVLLTEIPPRCKLTHRLTIDNPRPVPAVVSTLLAR